MTYYIRYLLTDEKPITLEDIEQAVQPFGAEYEVDGEYLVFHEEIIGQMDIIAPGHDFFKDEIQLLIEFAEQKQSKDLLLSEFGRVQSLLTIKVVFMLEHDTIFQALNPLLDWLLANRKGLLVDEGGYFQNQSGDLE